MPYPPVMNFSAYDDLYDPVLECGHRSGAQCDCYSDCEACGELYLTETEDWVEVEGKVYCEGCGEEMKGEDE